MKYSLVLIKKVHCLPTYFVIHCTYWQAFPFSHWWALFEYPQAPFPILSGAFIKYIYQGSSPSTPTFFKLLYEFL